MSHPIVKFDGRATRLLDALAEDAEAASAAEVREDIKASGGDPDQIADQMRNKALALLMSSRKTRLTLAQNQLRDTPRRAKAIGSAGADRIRQKLRELVSRDGSFANGRVALAFRNGATQSDNDVLSLWQDLVDLGAVSDDDIRD